MVIAPLSLRKDYWQNFELTDKDLEYLYSYLFEIEKPQTEKELIDALVDERIRQEKIALEQAQQSAGMIYYPKDQYEVGQTLQFPSMNWQTGKVLQVRPGSNPELPPFDVIEVELAGGEKRNFAAGLEEHALNQPVTVDSDDPLLNRDYVLRNFSETLSDSLYEALETSPDLVRIAGRWFPRALLVDINVGHLNLAEAVLDMMGGGPLPTRDLMEQIDMPTDVDSNLNEFSLNLALQEDKRFDEVGPSGEVLWYLHRLEPEPVREVPPVLQFTESHQTSAEAKEMLQQFEAQVIDELEPALNATPQKQPDEVTVNLIYPHWRAGTLPLAGALAKLFPTALESPRVQFTFVDGNSGEKFSGWVVRPLHYIYGLRDWYESQGLITGSLVHIKRGKNPGEIIVRADKKRGAREWIRTVVIGSDGGIVFSMLKHNLTAAVDERMAIAISDVDALEKVWERVARQKLSSTVRQVMTDMAKLSPQSHVHAQELYSGVNILRRCPPGAILDILIESPWVKHLGNLYFRLEDASGGDNE